MNDADGIASHNLQGVFHISATLHASSCVADGRGKVLPTASDCVGKLFQPPLWLVELPTNICSYKS